MRIFFCFGSNIGDREKFITDAVKMLVKKLSLKNVKISSILETKALLLPNSPKEWDLDFLNLSISANINIKKFPPFEILRISKDVECQIGRTKLKKWSPREIDIDIIKIGNLNIDEEILTIPHPGLFDRDFVQLTIKQV